MELREEGPSTPSVIYDEQGNMIDSRGEGGEPIQFVFEEIVWSAELSREEASRHLEVTMYPFKKVSWPLLSIKKQFFCITDSYLNILKCVVKCLQQQCPVKNTANADKVCFEAWLLIWAGHVLVLSN